MPTSNKYYPTLSSIISPDDIPDSFGFFKEEILDLLDKIHYADLRYSKSPKGDAAFYSLSIIVRDRLEIELFGSGIKLLFNAVEEDADISGFLITLEYQWQILAYLRDFNIENIGFLPQEIFELLLSVLQISEQQAIAHFINLFVEPANAETSYLEQFVEDIKIATNEEIVLTPPTEDTTLTEIVKELYQKLKERYPDVSAYSSVVLFGIYILDTNNIENTKEKLNKYFRTFLPDDLDEYIQNIVIPKAATSVELSAAVEFPREILKPVGEENAEANFQLDIGAITFKVDTQKGIDYQGEIEIDGNYPAELGETGFILNLERLKLDLSDDSNIIEADLDGRGTEFKGVFIEEVAISLPPNWFKPNNNRESTLRIYGRNLLIGTGGMSGRIGLEAVVPDRNIEEEDEASFYFGGQDSFQIGFKKFDILWSKGNIESSNLEGFLKIPRFNRCNENGVYSEGDLDIGVEMFLSEDGDFSISAKPEDAFRFCMDDVFIFEVHDMEIGRDDGRFYLCFSGGISFKNNDLLREVISEPIIVKDFCIYSDGSFEIGGGSIPLPDTIRIPFGPVELSVNAIHFGTYERQKGGALRTYRYFGFDAGLNINPGGVEANGKGLKYYFTINNDEENPFDHYLQIESLQIDLQFPGDVEPEKAALIASGFLSIDGPEYTGAISFKLPQMMLAGGAGMKYNKKHPAFLIDAFIELPASIPIANSGLGIYGFRGLFGLRYIAARDAIGIRQENDGLPVNTWTEYYNADPERGVHVQKFKTPENAGNPLSALSIGAGVSIATLDGGKSFSSQLFLLISLLDTILLEGKANIMGTRVGLTSEPPPIGVVLSFNRGESILFDVVVDYNLPTKESLVKLSPAVAAELEGSVLNIDADINAGFFFNDPGAWYVNLGTKEKKMSGIIYRLFLVEAYLMISKKRIEAGAVRGYRVEEKYGPVKVTGDLTFEIWGQISFTNTTIGGGIRAVGGINVGFMGVGFGFHISPYLSAIAPEPFLIKGGIDLCVEVNLLLTTKKKCFTVGFKFPKDTKHPPDSSPIYGLPSEPILVDSSNEQEPVEGQGDEGVEPPAELPVKGIHMVSGQEYIVDYLGAIDEENNLDLKRRIFADFLDNEDEIAVLPMDCWIDIEFSKPVNPEGEEVSSKIRGMMNSVIGNQETIPPKGDWNEKHNYSLENIQIEYFDRSDEQWKPYFPYQEVPLKNIAVVTDEGELVSNEEIGKWQIVNRGEHKKIRLLADSPFSYTNAGQLDWYKPGQAGVTGASLFCEGTRRSPICIEWNSTNKSFEEERRFTAEKLTYRLLNSQGEVGILESCKNEPRKGLVIDNGASILLYFHEPVREITLDLGTTNDLGFSINYFSHRFDLERNKEFLLIESDTIEGACKSSHKKVFDENVACTKIEIISHGCDSDDLKFLVKRLNVLEATLLITKDKEELINLISQQEQLKEEIYQYKLICCKPIGGEVIDIYKLKECEHKLIKAENIVQEYNNRIDQEGCDRQNPTDVCKSLLKKLKDLLDISNQRREEYEECLKMREELECKSILLKLCFLTEEDYFYNLAIPDVETLQERYTFLSPENSGNIKQVIWKPNTIYRCQISLKDTLVPFSNASGTEHKQNFYFGFKTGNPIGHFSLDRISKKYFNPRSVDAPDIDDLIESMQAKTSIDDDGNSHQLPPTPENHLKYYIDFAKSFPNADGDLLYAKPLYYKSPYEEKVHFNIDNEREREIRQAPSILLFFKDIVNYADLFFKDWNTDMPSDNLVIDILDSLDNDGRVAGEESGWERISVSQYFANKENENVVHQLHTTNADSILSSFLEDAPCVGASTVNDPTLQYLRINMTKLKPNKLYSVIIKNKYGGIDSVVHNFNFKTSIYANFKEHMSSYLLEGSDDNERPLRAAFEVPVSGVTDDDFRACLNIVNGNPINNELDQIYPDDFDKLVYGVLKQTSLPPPECNEFNFVKREDDQGIIGIWIRSKEPFNDPKIPKAVLDEFEVLEVFVNRSKHDIKYVMSKDYTQIYVIGNWFGTFSSRRRRRLSFKFKYLEPTKDYYEVISTYEMKKAIVVKSDSVG